MEAQTTLLPAYLVMVENGAPTEVFRDRGGQFAGAMGAGSSQFKGILKVTGIKLSIARHAKMKGKACGEQPPPIKTQRSAPEAESPRR